jgi:hypothetical protein
MLAMFHLAYLGVMFDQVRKQKLYLLLSDMSVLFTYAEGKRYSWWQNLPGIWFEIVKASSFSSLPVSMSENQDGTFVPTAFAIVTDRRCFLIKFLIKKKFPKNNVILKV